MALSKITNGGITGMSVSSTDVTVSSGDLLFGTAAKGVCLGVTSNTDSNTLEDYEEGTWTPTINASGFTSVSYAAQVGKYRKIGNTVNAYMTLRFTGTSAGGIFRIDGLPFTAVSDGTAKAMLIAYGTMATYLDEDYPHMYVGGNQDYIRAYDPSGNEARANAAASNDWFEGVVIYNT